MGPCVVVAVAHLAFAVFVQVAALLRPGVLVAVLMLLALAALTHLVGLRHVVPHAW